MDKSGVRRRLAEAGLSEARAAAVADLVWHVHVGGEVDERDIARLSDAGFRHLDICVMRELLDAALSRRRSTLGEEESPATTLLGALGGEKGP